jgi:hypothetical protein
MLAPFLSLKIGRSSKKVYKPYIQKLYDYCIGRIEFELSEINKERQAEEESFLSLSEAQVEEAAQELLNHIVDTEEFAEVVVEIIMGKVEDNVG